MAACQKVHHAKLICGAVCQHSVRLRPRAQDRLCPLAEEADLWPLGTQPQAVMTCRPPHTQKEPQKKS